MPNCKRFAEALGFSHSVLRGSAFLFVRRPNHKCFSARLSRESSHNATGQTRLHNAVLRSPVASSRCHKKPDRYISANNNELSHASMFLESQNWILPLLRSTQQ